MVENIKLIISIYLNIIIVDREGYKYNIHDLFNNQNYFLFFCVRSGM